MVQVTKVTEGVKITISSYYEEGSSRPLNQYFAFSYIVEIENNSPFEIQLMRRYWIIRDANGDVKEVEGTGVIGKTPIIKPGGTHTYSSWSPLATPIGKMAGYYTMKRLMDSSHFKAYIPEFKLVADYILN